jgi:antitoxin (DNA-binding transcriptional repressor) of toxin-antitoxin stability system
MSTGQGTLIRPSRRVSGDDARIYSMRDLNQHTAQVMSDIEEHGPAFITKHGRFIAVITPLHGQVESRVLAAMAREIKEEAGS